MSTLREERRLESVEVNTRLKLANVKWLDCIFREGVETPISATPHRCSYSVEQKEQFCAEVEGAENFIAALGW